MIHGLIYQDKETMHLMGRTKDVNYGFSLSPLLFQHITIAIDYSLFLPFSLKEIWDIRTTLIFYGSFRCWL